MIKDLGVKKLGDKLKMTKNNFTWNAGSHYYFSNLRPSSKFQTTQATHYAGISKHPPSLCLITIKTLPIGGRFEIPALISLLTWNFLRVPSQT